MYLLVFALALAAPAVWSAESDSSETVTATNLQSFGTPPEYRAMATMQLGNMLKCTTTPALQGLGDLFKDGLKGTVDKAGGCGREGSITESALSCTTLQDSEGNYSSLKVEQAEREISTAMEAISCRKGKIEGLKNELSCLTQEANMLAQQVGTLQSSYVQNIQRQQQDVAKLTAIEDNRKAQFKDTSEKLTGEGVSGGKGLLGLREEMQKTIAGIPKQIQEVKEAQLDMERQRKALDEMAEARVVVLANTCFNKPRALKCVPNGPPVNAREYVLCRYRQNQKLGPTGVIREGALADAQATSKAQELENILNAISEDSPADLGTAKSQEEVQSLSNRPVKILSAEDIQTHYGAQLAGFNGNGLDISSFVINAMRKCFNDAGNSVKRERKIANSTLSQAQEAIKKKERDTVRVVNELLNGYSQLNSEVMAGLTGQHLPLNITGCQNAKPSVQAGCLTDIRRNLEGLLAGSTPQSTVSMVIRGSDASKNINFSCQGLNGCITYMQNIQRNVKTELEKVGQFKKDYILKANQSVDQFTEQMAQQMSSQSQALNNRIQQLNATLATMGIRPGIRVGEVRGRPLKKGEDGLYEMPENVLDLIGSKMNPKMKDVQGDDFNDAQDGIASKVETLEEKEGELRKAQIALLGLKTTCLKEIAGDLKKDLQEFSTNNCTYWNRDCSKDGQESILSSDLGDILGSIGGLPRNVLRELGSVPGSLSTGFKTACESMRGAKDESTADAIESCAKSVQTAGNEGKPRPECVNTYLDPVPASSVATGIVADSMFKLAKAIKNKESTSDGAKCEQIVGDMKAKQQKIVEATTSGRGSNADAAKE
ncbi:MAG: hypothetical protein A2X94_16350 [Bdellovibrionales bacterium GWB1_55_8]|nr:MAG: hypothetical protein A2X94_16350 [Bdellovibrionales bacterium GWB1_55_8]